MSVLLRNLRNVGRAIKRRKRWRPSLALAKAVYFNPQWYRKQHASSLTAQLDPWGHYKRHARLPGYDPNPAFASSWYAEKYLANNAQETPIGHYVRLGASLDMRPSPIFDRGWYLKANADVAAAGIEPLRHFLEHGSAEGRSPGPYFDAKWYKAQHKSSGAAHADPLGHYFNHARQAGYDPNPAFASAWYANQASDLGRQNPLIHYLDRGVGLEANPHPLFDAVWYREEIGPDKTEALLHYLTQGSDAGRNPHPLFDARFYSEQAGLEGVHPLTHYMVAGLTSTISTHPLFDAIKYAAAMRSKPKYRTLLEHFEMHPAGQAGISPLLDVEWYLASHGLSGETNALAHYLRMGSRRNHNPNELFDLKSYVERYPDIRRAGLEPLSHYARWGWMEGRQPSPKFDGRFYSLTQKKWPAKTDPLARFLEEGSDEALMHPSRADTALSQKMRGVRCTPDSLVAAIGVVVYNESEEQIARIVETSSVALRRAGAQSPKVIIFDNGGTIPDAHIPDGVIFIRRGLDQGFSVGHNTLMRTAFDEGADVYIGANPDGAFHPDAVIELLKMATAQNSGAIIEAIQFPDEHPKFYDPSTLETDWISGACFLIPRKAYDSGVMFDEQFYLYCEDVDISWNARRLGFKTLICPTALFYHDVSDRGHDPYRYGLMLTSARYLAHKWDNPAFKEWAERQLIESGLASALHELPDVSQLPIIDEASEFTDFDHYFHFTGVRWD